MAKKVKKLDKKQVTGKRVEQLKKNVEKKKVKDGLTLEKLDKATKQVKAKRVELGVPIEPIAEPFDANKLVEEVLRQHGA